MKLLASAVARPIAVSLFFVFIRGMQTGPAVGFLHLSAGTDKQQTPLWKQDGVFKDFLFPLLAFRFCPLALCLRTAEYDALTSYPTETQTYWLQLNRPF